MPTLTKTRTVPMEDAQRLPSTQVPKDSSKGSGKFEAYELLNIENSTIFAIFSR